MRKWTSNLQESMKELQKNPTFSKSEQSINTDNSTSATLKVTHGNQPKPESNPRVLGQIWNTSTDQLKINLTKILDGVNHSNVTKRIILSTTAKFYDPLDTIVLMFKLLFQQLCKSNLSWNEILNEDMTRRWQLVINNLKDAREIFLNRCYCKELFLDEAKSVQLHAFKNASESSYGARVYLRCEHESDVHCNFVAAKT